MNNKRNNININLINNLNATVPYYLHSRSVAQLFFQNSSHNFLIFSLYFSSFSFKHSYNISNNMSNYINYNQILKFQENL